MAGIFDEWVVSTTDGEFVLTEAQHRFLVENQDKRFVNLDDITINPAFVSSAYKRPVQTLKQKYPCEHCNGNGTLTEKDKEGNWKTCPRCEGTGASVE